MHRCRWGVVLVAMVASLLVPSSATAESNGGPKLTVMTRNLYLGTDLTDNVLAETPAQLVAAVTIDWGHVVDTDFPTRAGALAAEVRATRPDVIGLQEVTLWRDQFVSDLTGPNASRVVYDFLAILLDRLAAAGTRYVPVSESVNADVEAPRVNPASPNGLTDVRITDRDVILVRAPLAGKFTNPQDGHYAAQLQIPSPPPLGTVVFTRGWASIDYRHDARTTVRIFDTHLDTASPPESGLFQVAQGNEFLALVAASPYPVIALGDFNSSADGSDTPTYANLTARLTDAWSTARPGDPGFTWGQPELLDGVQPATRRIDLILTSTPWPADRAEVVGDVPFRATPAPIWASDHFGVAVRLTLQR